jgi:hypothetical protein
MSQIGYLQILHRDARSTERKISSSCRLTRRKFCKSLPALGNLTHYFPANMYAEGFKYMTLSDPGLTTELLFLLAFTCKFAVS